MRIFLGLLLLLGAMTSHAACPDPAPLDTLCIEWQAPTENVDGTPLTDLDGYQLFWALTAGDWDPSRMIDIPDEGLIEFTSPATAINIPAPPGGGNVTVFFVMTAYDTGVLPGPAVNCEGDPSDDGNDPGNEVDCRGVSAFSNQVGKVIPFPDVVPGEPTILNIIINVTT